MLCSSDLSQLHIQIRIHDIIMLYLTYPSSAVNHQSILRTPEDAAGQGRTTTVLLWLRRLRSVASGTALLVSLSHLHVGKHGSCLALR